MWTAPVRALPNRVRFLTVAPVESSTETTFEWLTTGDVTYAAGQAAIRAAQRSIRLEVYVFADSPLGRGVLQSLMEACQRGVEVRVLVDAIGSLGLPDSFWTPLRHVGGEVRWFNPLSLERFAVRDHRKLLACDGEVALIGGFNIAPEYEGDGVSRGWKDVALKIRGEAAGRLAAAFDVQFGRASYRHARLLRFRKFEANRAVSEKGWSLLFSGPGRGRNPLLRALLRDLAHASDVRIMVAYFLPTLRLRRALTRVARRGGCVRLILPGRSDVALSRFAAQSLYRRLLRAGVEIFEYQPQVLHAKLFIVDDAVYVGSSNLDPRSLRINYELMARITAPEVVAEAREFFDQALQHATVIDRMQWAASRTWWHRLRQRWAHFLLARVDPLIASRQYRRLQ